MSVEKTPNGRWKARWRDERGKPRSQTFDRKVDATRHDRAMHADKDRGLLISADAGGRTVAAWAKEWLTGARDLGDGGRETYARDLERYILPALGPIQLAKLRDDHIDDYLTAELDAGVAPSSVHRHYRTLHRMFQVAIEKHKLSINPCAPVKPPRVERAQMRFLTVTEIDALAYAMDELLPAGVYGPPRPGRYRAWVFTAAWTGMRWSELVGLRRQHVKGDRVTVAEQLIKRADGEFHRAEPKTSAGRRTITLPDFAADELERHLHEFSLPGPGGLVFPNQLGHPLGRPSFRSSVWVHACGRAGIADVEKVGRKKIITNVPRIHDLRHTHVALMIAAGAHPKAIQMRLGHSSIRTTMDLYGGLFSDIEEAIAGRLSDLRASS